MHKLFRFVSVLVVLVMVLGFFAAPIGGGNQVNAQKEVPTFVVAPTEVPSDVPTEVAPTDVPTPLPGTGEDTPVEPTQMVTPLPTDPSELAPLIEAADDRVVAGQYIVVFKDGVDQKEAMASAQASIAAAGDVVTQVYDTVLNGFAAKLSPAMLSAFRADPRVEYIEEDQIVRADDEGENPFESQVVQTSPPSWGLDWVDQTNLPLSLSYSYAASGGTGVTVYVLDSGIRFDHQEYSGRAKSGYDFIDNDADASDCAGHGTHVAGTIGGNTVGIARNVSLVSVRVLNCDKPAGNGTYAQVIAGINWVGSHAKKPAVANMSLGGSYSLAENTAVKNAIAKGITFVVSAGNADVDACGISPASEPQAITVGATNILDQRTSFGNTGYIWGSNFGTCLDIFAPGSAITSSTMTSTNSYEAWDGTSMAAPHVAGAAALYLSGNPKASPATVAAALIANSTKDVVSNPAGSPNRLLFVTSPLPAVVPVLIAPSNGTVMRVPVLTWKSVNNADVYQVQLASDSVFTSPMAEGSGISALQYSPNTITDGKWYWRVRAFDEDGNPGGWSAVRYFTYDKTAPLNPVLLLPTEGSTVIGTPTFKWASSDTAKSYQFGYSTVIGSEPLTYATLPIKTTSIKPPAMEDGTYYWFVRAIDTVGNMSSWGTAAMVHIRPLVPAAPTGLIINSSSKNYFTNDTTPTFHWNKVTYGSRYHIQIARDSKFTDLVDDMEAVMAGLNYTTVLLSEGKYYWHVQARNSEGAYGKYSVTGSFTIDTTPPLPPILVSPTDNKVVAGTTTFSWKASATAKIYHFGLGSTSDTTPTLVFPYNITSTSYKPIARPEGTYRWFVRAIDEAGNMSVWSNFLTVVIDPTIPVKPTLASPANGASLTSAESVILTWNPVFYGHKYNIQIDSISNFSSPDTYISAIGATSFNLGSLPAGKWYWRVQAENSKGGKSPFSSTNTFTVFNTMDTEFNTNGVKEGWVDKAGASWSVIGGIPDKPGYD